MGNPYRTIKAMLMLTALILILTVSGCNSSTQTETAGDAASTVTKAKNYSPPDIPHEIAKIENCLDCHRTGLNGRAPKTPHPNRVQCTGCHNPRNGEIAKKSPLFELAEDLNWGQSPEAIPRSRGEYIILTWSDTGMKFVSDIDKIFGLSFPSHTLYAQVFKRGNSPQLVTTGIEIRYKAPENRINPSATLDYWQYAPFLYNKKIPLNVGLSGSSAASGLFRPEGAPGTFSAKSIPVSPYNDLGKADPYPLYTVQAVDNTTGRVLAETKTVLPVSAENGCYKCHGGSPARDGSGISEETAKNILAVHDQYNGTKLVENAEKGNPRQCQSCHSAANIDAKGGPGILSLSAAIHGWHAQYIRGGTADKCGLCHPSGITSSTHGMRDVHAGFSLQCERCHGTMALHAGSVLMNQKDNPDAVASMNKIKKYWDDTIPEPRTPWVQEPDCFGCHPNHTKASKTASAYNKWTTGPTKLYRNDKANGGIRCAACHGSPHLIYPNSTVDNRVTNYQPESYMGAAGPIGFGGSCLVCHTLPISGDFIHPHIDQPFYRPAKSSP